MLIVKKFGGTSVADKERIERVAGRCIEDYKNGNDVIVVLSAMGKYTDELIGMAKDINDKPPKRELDMLMTIGEQMSGSLMAMAMNKMGVPAVSLNAFQVSMHTTSAYGNARIKRIDTERIRRELDVRKIVIVTGFQGVNKYDDLTTLGRGGSDTTAVALAAAMHADACEIYTDVDGIYTADPRLLPSARLLRQIDSRDMLILARAGSQVLHPGSVKLALERAVPVTLLSSFRAGEGSRVLLLPEEERPGLVGVTRDAEKNSVTVVGRAADAGLLERLRQELEHSGIPVREARAGEGCVTITVAPAQLLPALELCHRAVIA